MFFDNYNNGQTNPITTKATPSTGFQQPAASPFAAPKVPASEPDTSVNNKVEDVDDDDDGNDEGGQNDGGAAVAEFAAVQKASFIHIGVPRFPQFQRRLS